MTSLAVKSKSKWSWSCCNTTHVIKSASKPLMITTDISRVDAPAPAPAPTPTPTPVSVLATPSEPMFSFSRKKLASIVSTLASGPDYFIHAPPSIAKPATMSTKRDSKFTQQIVERILFTTQCVASYLWSFRFSSEQCGGVKWHVSVREHTKLTIFVNGLDIADVLRPVLSKLRVKHCIFSPRDESRACSMQCDTGGDGCYCRWDHFDIHSSYMFHSKLKVPAYLGLVYSTATELSRIVQVTRLILMGANVGKMFIPVKFCTWDVRSLCSAKMSAIRGRVHDIKMSGTSVTSGTSDTSDPKPHRIIRILVPDSTLHVAILDYFGKAKWGFDNDNARADAKPVKVIVRTRPQVYDTAADCPCCSPYHHRAYQTSLHMYIADAYFFL